MTLVKILAIAALALIITQAKATPIALDTTPQFQGSDLNHAPSNAFKMDEDKTIISLESSALEANELFNTSHEPLTFKAGKIDTSPLIANPRDRGNKISNKLVSLPEPSILTMLILGVLCLGLARRNTKSA